MSAPFTRDVAAPGISLRLLGGFDVRLGGRLVAREAFTRRKAISLLKLLALQPGLQLHREQALDLLWPDLNVASGSRQLYKTIYYVRQAFVTSGVSIPGDELLKLESDVLSLSAPSGVELDVETFEQLARAALRSHDLDDLQHAASAYSGDLLPDDRFEPWTEPRRGLLQETFADLLVTLGAGLLARGELAEASDTLRQALARDATREDAHRALMHVFARQGSRGRAVRQYQRCARILDREIGVAPAAETEELYEAILTGQFPTAPPSPARHRPRPADLRPLVGREAEQRLIAELLDRLAAGHGAVLTIEGEAGIGKTRLTEQILQLGQRRRWPVLVGGTQEQEGQFPYRPFIEALRQALWISPSDAELIPAELAISIPELPGTSEPIHTADKLAAQNALFAGVLRFLRARMQQSPLVLILDDLHAADAGSLKLFHYLARQTANLPLLIVCAYRTGEAAPTGPLRNILNSLNRLQLVHQIELAPLLALEQHALLAQLLENGSIAPELAAEITALGEGNPLFTRELAQQLVADGRIIKVDDVWQLRDEPDTPNAVPIPRSLQALIARRLATLSRPAIHVIQLTAVLGREIPLPLLERGLDTSEIGPSLLDGLDETLRAGLLVESGLNYRFSHALMREAIYQQLSIARARALHRTVALSLETLYRDQPSALPLDALAHHFERAGETTRAVHYLVSAGDQAGTVYDHDGALRRYLQALRLLDEAEPAQPSIERSVLLERIGDTRQAIGDVAQSHDAYVQALTAAEHEAAPGTAEHTFSLTRKLALGAILTGDLPSAAEYLAQVAGAGASDPLDRARLLIAQALFDWHANQPEAAIEHASQALALAEQLQSHEAESQACEMLALAHLTTGNWSEGTKYELRRQTEDWSPEIVVAIDAHLCLYEYRLHGVESYRQMQRFLESVAAQTEALGNLRCLAVCHYALGALAFLQGLPRAALENLAHAFELHERIDSPAGMAYTLAAQAELLTALGDLDAGQERIHQGLDIARQAAIRDHCLMRLHTAGLWNRLAAHDQDGLEQFVRIAKAHDAEAGPCTVCRVALYEALAAVDLTQGDLEAGLHYTEQALNVAAFSQNQPGRARALRIRAQLLAARGEAAEPLLVEALEIFQTIGDRYDLARTLLVWDDLVDHQRDDPERIEQLREAIDTLARFTPSLAGAASA